MLVAPRGSTVFLMVLVVVAGVIAALMLIGGISDDTTTRKQAEMSAAVAAERERTERERITSQAQQHAAELRAEQDARVTGAVAIIAAVGVIAILGLVLFGGIMAGLSWMEGKQMQRTLLLLEARQRAQAHQLPEPNEELIALPRARNRVQVIEITE